MKKPGVVYADKKSEEILHKNFWKPSAFDKTEGGGMMFPFSAPTKRSVFPVELASKGQTSRVNYFIVVKFQGGVRRKKKR